MASAPSDSGVYALYSGQDYIYIGESGDIKTRLLHHLNGDNPCINANKPSSFSYEVSPEHQRVTRQNDLILEFRPLCNKK
jgi:hypothetical protein